MSNDSTWLIVLVVAVIVVALGLAAVMVSVALPLLSRNAADMQHHERRMKVSNDQVIEALRDVFEDARDETRELRHDVQEVLRELRDVGQRLHDREGAVRSPGSDIERPRTSIVERRAGHGGLDAVPSPERTFLVSTCGRDSARTARDPGAPRRARSFCLRRDAGTGGRGRVPGIDRRGRRTGGRGRVRGDERRDAAAGFGNALTIRPATPFHMAPRVGGMGASGEGGRLRVACLP